MTEDITPQTIENGALGARVTVSTVLERAKVSRTAYYRWRRGEGNMLPLTKLRLQDAVNELRAEAAV
ncbi:MAG TPA: hypothetical protein DF966_18315 [Sulfitobacter sp.]|nr:hypothetical protein [Sulfitobacter sp.]|tara:strand:- start:302 stop:502 length:201 start_codon:yes stop_codon:yes gene_type:complete